MPNRILKESICTSDTIDGLSWFEEVLFYRLIVNCDDYGRFDGRPAIIKNRLFPLKESITVANISKAVKTLASAGLVIMYAFDDKPYLFLPTWNDHQIVRAKRSKYPQPPTAEDCADSETQSHESTCNHMHADVSVIQSNPIQSEVPPISLTGDIPPKGDTTPQEDIPSPKKAKRFMPPTVEEVAAYCKERGNKVDAEAFVAHYKSKGWKVGREPMRDWKAAVITWERRAKEREELPRAITSPPQRRNPAVLRSRQYSTDELSKMGKELLEDT